MGDRIGAWVLQQVVEKSQFRYTRLYTEQAEAEILLVGNSRGLMFYQPHIEEITGKSTFNVCYNGMPINLATVLVQDYFDLYEAPEHLILDITMCDRRNNGLLAGFSTYAPYSERLEHLILDTIPKVGYGGKVSNLYRYNSEVFQRSLAYLNKSDEFWTNDRVMNDFLVEDAANLEEYNITFEDSFLEELKTIKDLCQQNKTNLHFVVNPYYPAFAEKMMNLDSINQVIEREVGVEVHDYRDFLTDRTKFSDYQHTNTNGSVEYLNQLQKDGILPLKQ